MPRIVLTGARETKRDELLLLARQKVITWDKYNKRVDTLKRQEVKYLEKKEQKALEKEKKREQKEKEREQEIAENRRLGQIKRKETIEKKKKADKDAVNALKKAFDATESTSITSFYEPEGLYEWVKKNASTEKDFTFIAQVNDNGWETLRIIPYLTSSELSLSAWFEVSKGELLHPNESMMTIFAKYNEQFGVWGQYDAARVLVLPYEEVKSVALANQFFREGEQHCVFEPLAKFWGEQSKKANNKKAITMCKTYENKCRQFAVQFDKGISAADLEIVLSKCGVSMEIVDLLQSQMYHINKTSHADGNRRYTQFMNTKMNHLEMVENNRAKEVTADEMGHLFKTIDVCAYRQPSRSPVPSWINCAKGEFKLVETHEQTMNDFGKKIGLRHFKFDAVENKGLWKFLHGALETSNLCMLGNYSGKVDELDMTNAYANFGKNKYYKQFHLPAALHHFRNIRDVDAKDFLKDKSGIFSGIVFGVPSIAKKFGMVEGGLYTFFTPVWMWLMDKGADVILRTGAWGSTCDWSFTEEMIQQRMPSYKGHRGARLYAPFVGRLMSKSDEVRTYVRADQDMICNLKAAGHKIRQMQKMDCGKILAEVVTTKGSSYTAIHQGIAIQQYTLLTTLMEAEKYGDNVLGIHLDAVLLKPGVAVANDLFRIKSSEKMDIKKQFDMFRESRMVFSDADECEYVEENTLFLGAGGTGKTYSVMNKNSGYISPLYTSKAWETVVDNRKKYGAKGYCLHNILGIDGSGKETVSFEDRFCLVPNVLFVDEITQVPIEWIKNLETIFPYSLIIAAGDYDEKGRPFQTSEFGCVKLPKMPIKMFENDLRAKDSEKLKEMKLFTRSVMSHKYGDILHLIEKVVAKYSDRIISRSDAKKMMKAGDWFLTNTRNKDDSQVKTLTRELINERPDLPLRHLVVSHNMRDVLRRAAGEEAFIKGDVLESEIVGRTEPRHAFTVHATQGKTIESNIFIEIRGMFDFSALYTAISRATKYENVYLVV